MINNVVILFFCVFTLNLSGQIEIARFESFKIDTNNAILQISNLNNIESHKEFWDEIWERDQTYRGVKAVDSIDAKNLILVSYYFNKFGYSKRKNLGDQSTIINTVWIHNKYTSIKKLVFPIILRGYLEKEIDEHTLRIYYLKNLYKEKYNDNGNMSKPLKEIFRTLGLCVNGKINISEVVTEFEFYNNLNITKTRIGQWRSEEEVVVIFRSENNRYYFRNMFLDGGYEPKLLKKIEGMANSFRFANKKNGNYFHINKDGTLSYLDPSGETIENYMIY